VNKVILSSTPRKDPIDGTLTLQEWQNWGTNSPVPASIIDAIAYLKAFERESDAQMIFGGNGGRLICWLPYEDCMCLKVKPCPLWRGIRFWLYMHPKDFLRQNNTGKVLWQVFGVEAATLCLFGIVEHEETMWNEFKKAG
ncbi:DTW domain-containing protein YfiP, partial [Bienertia sinuspersici]